MGGAVSGPGRRGAALWPGLTVSPGGPSEQTMECAAYGGWGRRGGVCGAEEGHPRRQQLVQFICCGRLGTHDAVLITAHTWPGGCWFKVITNTLHAHAQRRLQPNLPGAGWQP
jgi:hypothetical protein